jgi:Deoxyribonuclease NucA/NucB
MRRGATTVASLAIATALVAVAIAGGQKLSVTAAAPVAHAAATCSNYTNQKAAQDAADTRDGDGDGIYCEDLPCPCSTEAGGGDDEQDGGRSPESCTKPRRIQRLVFNKSEYPNIRRHFRIAVRKGWPSRLVINRRGADARRDRLLEDYPTKDGYDRDEYPPAVGRGKGEGLERGRNPRGWKAHVRYVPSSENRSHGASLGAKLADFCNGTRFRYVFR